MLPPAQGRFASIAGSVGVPAALRRLPVVLAMLLSFSGGAVAETAERAPAFAPFPDADWPTADARDYGYDTQRLSQAIERVGAEEGVYSVLLVRGGELIAEQYFREGTRTKVHNLKSASKSIISALIGLVIADGSLALDDSVVQVLDVEGVEPDRSAITVRDVLMMASGLESTSYEAYNAWIAGSDWVRGALRQEWLEPPGTRYRYSTGNTHLLSALVRRAAGQSTRSFAEARLFDPLDVEIGGWEADPQGIHIGGNNLALTPRDMARFGELFLRGGRWGDRQVVPAEWVRESTRIQIAADHEIYGDYGYQWFVSRRVPGDFMAVGFGGQYIYVSPTYDAVVVITSTLESKGREWEHRIFDVLEQDLLRADGVRITSRPGRDSSAFGPAGATAAPVRTDTEAEVRSEVRAEFQGELETAREQVATLVERVDVLERQQEEEARIARQRLERSEAYRAQAEMELERSRRALEESGKERARLAQLLEEAEKRELLTAEETRAERERVASRTTSQDAEVGRLRRELADANDQITQLQAHAQTRDLELERAGDELTRMTRRVEDRDEKVRDRDAVLEEQLERFQAERTDLESQLAEERGRADQTLREVQRMRQTETTLRDDLEARGRELTTARERAQTAEQALEARGARLASLQADLETLRAQGRADLADRQELTRTVEEMQTRLAAETAERTRLEADVAALGEAENLADARGDQLTQVRVAHREESTRRAEAEQQLAELQSTSDAARARVSSLESDIERLRSQLLAKEEAASGATDAAELARARGEELAALRSSLATETARYEQSQAEISTLRSALDEEKQRAASLESEAVQLRTSLDGARRRGAQAADTTVELESAQDRIATLEASLRDQQAEAAARRREVDQMGQRLGEAQQASRVQARQLENLQLELRTAQDGRARLEAEVRRLQAELETSSERRVSEVGREAEALSAAEARAADLEDRLSAARRETETLSGRVGDLEEELERAQTRTRDEATRFGDTREELRGAVERIAVLEARLDEVRRTSEARRVALEQAEAASVQRGDSRVDELVAQLESRDRSLAALQQELEVARAETASGPEPGSAEEVARIRRNYEALVAESEMLARRAGDQGRRIAELEQRLAATRTPEDLDRELTSVRTEVERLLSDRRLSEVLRADLVRLRRVLAALQSAREK